MLESDAKLCDGLDGKANSPIVAYSGSSATITCKAYHTR